MHFSTKIFRPIHPSLSYFGLHRTKMKTLDTPPNVFHKVPFSTICILVPIIFTTHPPSCVLSSTGHWGTKMIMWRERPVAAPCCACLLRSIDHSSSPQLMSMSSTSLLYTNTSIPFSFSFYINFLSLQYTRR